jgi:hypothetical protein
MVRLVVENKWETDILLYERVGLALSKRRDWMAGSRDGPGGDLVRITFGVSSGQADRSMVRREGGTGVDMALVSASPQQNISTCTSTSLCMLLWYSVSLFTA